MARYRVYEKFGHGHQVRRQKVYEDEVDQAIIAGRSTLQARPFGRCYHVDGRVFYWDDDMRVIPGVTCRFEEVTP